eukprot:Skav221462  [mRNA]  locus=scaffold1700:286312:292009:- [translate_table: standard]
MVSATFSGTGSYFSNSMRAQLVDDAAAAVEVSDDVTHVLLGGDHLHLHDGFHDDGLRLVGALLKGRPRRDLEGDGGAVHGVETAVLQGRLHVHHGETHPDAVGQLVLGAFQHGGDVLLGHGSADDAVVELEALSGVGLVDHAELGILAGTTCLLLVGVPQLHGLSDGLTVRHLGFANLCLHLELALQAVDDDLQVQLAHALDDGLVGLLISAVAEGWILSGQLVQGLAQLVGILLGSWLAGHLDHGLREVHLLQHHWGVHGAQGVASGGVL